MNRGKGNNWQMGCNGEKEMRGCSVMTRFCPLELPVQKVTRKRCLFGLGRSLGNQEQKHISHEVQHGK